MTTEIIRKVFVVARDRAAYDAWMGSFKHSDRKEYHYVAGHNDFMDDAFVVDEDELHFLPNWALNADYTTLFVGRLSRYRNYW